MHKIKINVCMCVCVWTAQCKVWYILMPFIFSHRELWCSQMWKKVHRLIQRIAWYEENRKSMSGEKSFGRHSRGDKHFMDHSGCFQRGIKPKSVFVPVKDSFYSHVSCLFALMKLRVPNKWTVIFHCSPPHTIGSHSFHSLKHGFTAIRSIGL